ncbi:MAG: DUF123 domain-containing protein [Candidatus Paceibacteria bacterium]
MKKGTYILIIQLNQDCNIEVGSLEELHLHEGYYCYIGSAFSPGGLKRVQRHKQVSSGENENIQWHIDYLNSHNKAEIIKVEKFIEQKIECELANKLEGEDIDGFGSSDCSCRSHLQYFENKSEISDNIKRY